MAGRRGFTRTDLLVVVAAVSVVSVVVIGAVVRQGRVTRTARCTENLRQVGRALLQFADDHERRFPGPTAEIPGDPWWWYKEQVRAYAGDAGPADGVGGVFACPDDRGYTDPRPFHASARFDSNSYPFNGVTLPGLPNLADADVSSVREPGRTLLVMEWTAHAPLSWHRSRTGRRNAPFYSDAESVVTFVDGRVALIPIYYDGYNAAYTRDPIGGYAYRFSAR